MRRAEISIADSAAASGVADLLNSNGWEVVAGRSTTSDLPSIGVVGGAGESVVLVCDTEAAEARAGEARQMVVLGETAEEALRVALRVGASDAVGWPGDQKLLLTAAESALTPKRSKVDLVRKLGFVSVRSAGATAIVANLAAALSRHGVEVTAVDCDLAHADLTGLLYEVEPATSLEDVAAKALRVDAATVDAKGVNLIAARGGGKTDVDSLRRIGEWASVQCDTSKRLFLYDLPSAFVASCGDRFGASVAWVDIAVVIVPLDFGGVRRARMVIDAWPEELRSQIRLLIVRRRRHGLDAADALEVLALDDLGCLPSGGEALDDALDEGRLLGVRPGTPYGRAIDQLAKQIELLAFPPNISANATSISERSGSLFGAVSTRLAKAASR